MRARLFLFILASVALSAGLAWAGGPIATPEGSGDGPTAVKGGTTPTLLRAFGDSADYLEAAYAAAEYLRVTQADVTEDNAGNGNPDDDPDDGGWDWSSTVFVHSSSASPGNITGATAQGLYRTYLLDPRPAWFTSLKDAADKIVERGPTEVRSASDLIFLIDFAALPGVVDPQHYIDGAVAIWDYRMVDYGTPTGLAEGIRDVRGVTHGYPNGIIPWDIGLWVEAAMHLHSVYPAGGYDVGAADMAEVLYQDSYNLIPGYFDVYGRNQGYDPAWGNVDYWWYTLGVTGLIQAFASAGVHTAEIPLLEQTLLECQYDDGAFSYQYGAATDIDDTDWQSAAYAMLALNDYLSPTAVNLEAIRMGGEWLASTQDVSGGFVYSSGTHYPEIGGECCAGLVTAWENAGAHLNVSLSEPGPINCGETMFATFNYDREEGTVGLRGYEITFQVGAEVSFGAVDIDESATLLGVGSTYFDAVDNLDGTWTVSCAILGTTAGLLADGDLFSVELHPVADGDPAVTILSYKLRDPDNVEFFADLAGASFTVDCTAPDAASDIAAAPGHNKVTVTWTEPGSDVAAVEVWRGMWYRSDTGGSAYPRYDDFATHVVPTRPTVYADLPPVDSGEWILAGTVAPGVGELVDTGMTERGVYWYEVIPVDAAGNPALPADANDAATSYWLGDVAPDPYDGLVDGADIAALGATFGLTALDGTFNFHADVGPSDDMSAVGIPTTDAVVDFEDLMLFAINYGVVGPAKIPAAVTPLVLAWVQIDETTWALELAEPCATLKGLRLRAVLPEGVMASVRGGSLLAEQADATFLRDLGGRGLDLNLALFGRDRGFAGTGELLRVELSAPVDLAAAAIEPRDLGNTRMEFAMGEGVRTPSAKDFALLQNYPNPFNPKTTIAFRLPSSQHVKLSVVGVDGGVVATLVDGVLPAGPHAATWTGRNDAGHPVASGAYFYRIDAGPWSETRKMILLK